MSAEPCWEYRLLIEDVFAGKTIWPVGYIDRTFCYLPTQAILPDGGYEVNGLRYSFGIQGEFVSNLEEVITTLISS